MTAPSARPSEEVPRRHPAHAVHGLQAPGTWGFAEATECWGLVGFPQKHAPPLRKRTLIYYALQSALRFIGWSLSLSLSGCRTSGHSSECRRKSPSIKVRACVVDRFLKTIGLRLRTFKDWLIGGLYAPRFALFDGVNSRSSRALHARALKAHSAREKKSCLTRPDSSTTGAPPGLQEAPLSSGKTACSS